jgi:hypothetical protein
MPEDSALREDYAIEYVRAHPNCCSILRNEPLGSSIFADLLGFKYFLIQVVYELSKAQIEAAAPDDSKIYEAFVEVSPCGKAIHAHGVRLQEWPQHLVRP